MSGVWGHRVQTLRDALALAWDNSVIRFNEWQHRRRDVFVERRM